MFEERIRHRREVNTVTKEIELVTETVCWDTKNDKQVAVTDSHTEVIPPGSDLTGRDAETAALCRGVWTPASVQEFDKKFAAQMAASQKMRKEMIDVQDAQLAQLAAQKQAVEENMQSLQALVDLNNQLADKFQAAQEKMRAQEKFMVQAYQEAGTMASEAAAKLNAANTAAVNAATRKQ